MLMACARHGLILAGLLASALSAGFFYSCSISVMPGLAATDPSSAILPSLQRRGSVDRAKRGRGRHPLVNVSDVQHVRFSLLTASGFKLLQPAPFTLGVSRKSR